MMDIELVKIVLFPISALVLGWMIGFLIGKYRQKFVRKKDYYKGRRIEEVSCADCNFSKYSCYRNGHCVIITLEDGTQISLLEGINSKEGFIFKNKGKKLE